LKPTSIAKLRSEKANPAARELDKLSALEIVRLMNREDHKVAPAVKKALPQIAKAVEWIAQAIARGGSLIYVGTGTSGRLGALDASECPPTFGVSAETVRFRIAGGERALSRATEISEDSRADGREDLAELRPGANDVVVGLAVSGRTPYTVAALEYARQRGARTVAVTCNHKSPLEKAAQLAIVIDPGPEVIAGSSRMKAGTAQKMVLNMLSTAAMARLGYVYGNRMVNVHTKNSKLQERGLVILEEIGEINRATAARFLREARGDVPQALVASKAAISAPEAAKYLKTAKGNVRRAIELANSASKRSYSSQIKDNARTIKMKRRARNLHG
jgi:N-acetylmuramic acid 6-phosphate etherase